MNFKFPRANLSPRKQSQTGVKNKVKRVRLIENLGLTHTHTHSTLTPVRVLHRCCLHLFPSLLEKYVKVSFRPDSLSFHPSTTSPLQHSSFLLLPLCCTRTSYPDTRTCGNGSPPYFPALSSPSLSSDFTPLFLFSAFLP